MQNWLKLLFQIIKEPYKQIESDEIEETNLEELNGSVIKGQEDTRKLWASWVKRNKKSIPTAPIPSGAKLIKVSFQII